MSGHAVGGDAGFLKDFARVAAGELDLGKLAHLGCADFFEEFRFVPWSVSSKFFAERF